MSYTWRVSVNFAAADIHPVTNSYLDELWSLPKPAEIDYKYKLVSLFSGGGGLDVGLALAGFEPKFSSDVEEQHCLTLSHNFQTDKAIPQDVALLTGEEIRNISGVDHFDLLCGGPPCQSFSILGRRGSFDDPRGKLVFEYVRLINELRPKAFLFENVPGLLTINGGENWKQLSNFFRDETGYSFSDTVLNAADFGVPQIRKRVIAVGFKDPEVHFSFPKGRFRDPEKRLSIFDENLPSWRPARAALVEMDGLPNNRQRIHGKRVRDRYAIVEPGKRDKVDHTDRVHPDRPSGTVLVGSQAGGGRPFIHPWEPRHLTIREAARLQSFPDWYEFQSTETWQFRQVGNAVPPLLARAIGEEISKVLDRESTLDQSDTTILT